MLTVNRDVSFGTLDAFVARRLMRHGPVEFRRLLNDKPSLMRMIVEYKWRNEPDVKLARKLNKLLRRIKFIDPVHYNQSRKQILEDVKAWGNGDEVGYKEFVKLINDPNLGRMYDGFVKELIDNSPKTRAAVLKLSDRDDVLQKFNLDYRSDYIVDDSKKVDVLLLKLVCLRAFCLYGTGLMFRYWWIYFCLQNEKARLTIAKCLWADCPDVINVYQYRFEARQDMCDKADKIYQDAIDGVYNVYHESMKMIERKHDDIKRYKELIKTGVLPVFKKK